ncbi:hypothetical protein IQ07DRAFT_618207, partial [Pyrenochaeta sp. DS3sAY3a]
MFHDLNVPWTDATRELQRAVVFLDELGYDVVALTHTYTGKLPADLVRLVPCTFAHHTSSLLAPSLGPWQSLTSP